MRHLPLDKHGHPIPWFVHVDDHGVPDFRVIRHRGIYEAARYRRCWVCGAQDPKDGACATFVIGPMCAINRVSAEPPSHLDCAIWSARNCPFLTTPNMVRRERHLPDGYYTSPASCPRNPGVALVWRSRKWRPFRNGPDVLFDVGDALSTGWWCQGREATREECLASMHAGLQILRERARGEGAGVREQARLLAQYGAALELVPA